MCEMAKPNDPHLFLIKSQQRSFVAFLQKAWPHVTGGELIDWNWHLDAIAYQLERIADSESRRLIVNVPPRNGKSKLISIIWVAFMLGQDPTLNFVCVSYSNELSSKLARDCLSIMQSDWYQALFPATKISRKRSANWDFETTRGGGRLATSVTGTLTGRGGDIIILDDVIKPEEAMSEITRASVNSWYQSTLSSRLNDKNSGAILCVMQRLHEYDLTGMLLEAGGWEHLSLPAICDAQITIPLTRGRMMHRKEGDVLHPEREPLEVLEELKSSMGSMAFSAQYQQDPVPSQGNVFKHDWLCTSPANLDSNGYGEIIQSWDTAIKAGQRHDYSVCITALLRGRDIHILQVWRGRREFPQLLQEVKDQALRFHNPTLLIEDKASGQELIQSLRSENHRGVPLPIPRIPTADKLTRAQGVSSIVEAGQLFLPEDANWLADFKSELLAFPNGRFDDQVDALTQLLEWVRAGWTAPQTLLVGPEAMSLGDYRDLDDYDSDSGEIIDPWSGV